MVQSITTSMAYVEKQIDATPPLRMFPISIMHNDRSMSQTLPYDPILGYEETVEGTPIPIQR
jgi:hypothetical protein